LRIAIVDDEQGILLSLSLFLELEGHIAFTFSSPLDAIKTIPNEDIDLIIMDMRMPEMSGEEAANIFKGNILTKNIPIILFSAHDIPLEVTDRVGAYGVLEKPFQFQKLTKLIDNINK